MKTCEYCHNPFKTKRAHARTCSANHRLALFRLERDYKLLIAHVPEAEVEGKYVTLLKNDCQKEDCSWMMFLHWYRYKDTKTRFADIYVPKQARSDELIAKLKKLKKLRVI